ncbi:MULTISPECIES: hypothetical protein [Wolbachia]|uniref:hypothetical protein n=1 Tax=Wolbachia TaxID=953 RepID=UPI001BD1EEDF|nr:MULTISPECIES: hypothetical protein [Wolbachia]MBS9528817.1 hypothetical protein [Wolbachia endosymbiont of Ceratitis capitata]
MQQSPLGSRRLNFNQIIKAGSQCQALGSGRQCSYSSYSDDTLCLLAIIAKDFYLI